MILKRLAFVFEPFSKSWKSGQIDQNGKGLPFTFCSIFTFFQLFKNASKMRETKLRVVENDSKAFSLCFWTGLKKLKKWPKLTKMVRG